ncbi:MAG: hypothetical protein ACFFAO_08215 [Candidatus Hermodarchaeota archaeon]
MMLNLSPEVIIDFITGFTFMIGGIILEIKAKIKKLKPLLLFGLVWIILALYYTIEGLAFMFMNSFLCRIYTILIFPIALFAVIFIDYTTKEKIGTIKISLAFGLGFLLLYLAFQPDVLKQTVEFGYPTFNWSIEVLIISTIMILYVIVLLYSWSLLVWFKQPAQLKKQTYYFLVGFTLMGPINFFIYTLIFIDPFFVIIADIIAIIGAIIIIYMILKQPKIFFILPFKAYTLIAIHRTGGYPLFSHSWNPPIINQDFFSMILNATERMSMEILLKGGIKSLDLESGILLIEKSELFVVGLLASKRSIYLMDCLNKFMKEFDLRFRNELIQSPSNTAIFNTAQELIDIIFAYIPSLLDNK